MLKDNTCLIFSSESKACRLVTPETMPTIHSYWITTKISDERLAFFCHIGSSSK
eukprot:c17734_g2_i1 orf=61-222(-)